MSLMMDSSLLWLMTEKPKMMSRFLMERLVTRLRSFSALMRRIPVSRGLYKTTITRLTGADVIVLTSMGEEVAIEAKEAPSKA